MKFRTRVRLKPLNDRGKFGFDWVKVKISDTRHRISPIDPIVKITHFWQRHEYRQHGAAKSERFLQ